MNTFERVDIEEKEVSSSTIEKEGDKSEPKPTLATNEKSKEPASKKAEEQKQGYIQPKVVKMERIFCQSISDPLHNHDEIRERLTSILNDRAKQKRKGRVDKS